MKINKIKCDVCGKETDGIVDAKKWKWINDR